MVHEVYKIYLKQKVPMGVHAHACRYLYSENTSKRQAMKSI